VMLYHYYRRNALLLRGGVNSVQRRLSHFYYPTPNLDLTGTKIKRGHVVVCGGVIGAEDPV
jgi:hypothetical protein